MAPAHETTPIEMVLDFSRQLDQLCLEIGSKLGSISIDDCDRQALEHSDWSTLKRSLAYKDYLPVSSQEPMGRVLLIGGIHGDEFASEIGRAHV